jgi:hypothetical protein
MKTTNIIITIVTMAVVGCAHHDVNPLMKKEANIGESFTVSAPAEVVFKESGVKLFFEHFTDYFYPGVLPSTIHSRIRYNGNIFDISHRMDCENPWKKSDLPHCNNQIISLDSAYTFEFEKIVATTKIKDNEAGADDYRVDSAQFILKTR